MLDGRTVPLGFHTSAPSVPGIEGVRVDGPAGAGARAIARGMEALGALATNLPGLGA